MYKTINKTLSILLVFTFIIGLCVVPPRAAHAAASKTDIAPSTLTTGTNVKVSSENSTKKAPFAVAHNGSDFWQFGGTASNVFPAPGNTGSLWIAVDLGTAKTFDEVSFDIPAGFSAVKDRIKDYEVLYTSTKSTWDGLPGTNNTSLVAYKWNTTPPLWSVATQVNVPQKTTPDANDAPNWGSLTPSNSSWTATTTGAFSPVTAQYVMIHFTVISGNPGAIGMSNLKILSTPTTATISPMSGSFTNGIGSAPSTTITLNGDTLSGITMTNSVSNSRALVLNQDYSLGAITDGAQSVTFTNAFLDSLPNGSTSVMFSFSSGSSQQYTLSVTVPMYADTYLNDRGSGYAIITPNYSGMSLTIGRPAVVDANAASSKFPIFNVSKALTGTSIAGKLVAPNGATAYNFPNTSVDAAGNAVMSVPDSLALLKGTYRAAFTLTNGGSTLYDDYYFTVIDDFANYKSTPNIQNSNNANVANVSPDSWDNNVYPAIQMDASGKVTYIPDYKGNQVMDYSAVGYKGGGVAIPNVPVRVKVSPLAKNTEDAWQTIQDAIDYVSRYPIQEDGFRGAVYLEPGVFRISKPLNVTTSGVVIRGAGAGTVTPVVGEGTTANPYDEQIASEDAEPGVTKLISTWKITDSFTPPSDHASTSGSPYTKASNSTLINFNGQGVTTSASTTITDQYVGAGQSSVHVASVSGLSVGDLVTVQKAINANWVQAMYMDKVDGASNWLPNGKLESGFAGTPFTAERTIKSIDAATKTLTFAEPLSDNLDMRWGISKIVKTAEGGRISNVGVENIQGISHFYNTTKPTLSRYGKNFLSYNDENHAEVFVAMVNVRDGWMRNFTTYHIDSAFVTDGSSRNITVQDGNVLDPVSLMDAGERRYSIYYKNSEYMFTQRVYSRYMRHAFIVDSYTSGPNVFYDSVSEYTSNASEPHFRWSSGGLYDNVSARIYLQNRWNMGTSHGWAGVNYMLYNFTGPFIASQPQFSPNYVIGHLFDNATNRLGSATDPLTGRQKPDKGDSDNMASAGLNGGKVPNFDAYEYSMTQKVTPAANHMPDSLYVQQLVNSHGPQAAVAIAEKTVPPLDDQASAQRPKLKNLLVDGQAVSGFSPDAYSYTVTLPLDHDYSKKAEITAQADAGVTVDIAYPQDGMAQITLTDAKGVKNFYSVSFSAIQKSPIVIASDQQVDASNSNYAVNVLNPSDYAGATSLRWAASGSAWIRMYLGETAKKVNGVQIGFVQQATSARTYKLRIEYSQDGQNWMHIPSGTVVSDTTASPTSWNNGSDTYINALTLNAANVSPAANTLQTFTFDSPVEARFIRIAGNGNMTGTTTNAWNTYWKLRPVFPEADPQYMPPTGVAISGPTTLNSTGSGQVQAQITPNTATVKDVIWTSSNPAIATVDSTGKVTAIAAGKVTITATTVDGTFVSAGVVQQASGAYELTILDDNPASSNTDLSSLTLSSGTLSPAFASGTTEYTSSVASAVSSTTVTASVYDKNATMTVNGNPVASGQASGTINLQVGSTPITIVVTAQDGTTNTYSVTVNRAQVASSNTDLSSLTLSSGTLSPVFASGTTAYTSSVASAVSSITVTASVYDKNATMTVNGNPVASGQASGAINLQVGSNPITIVVTAQNGTTNTYSVTVNRAQVASSNTDLSSLTLSSGSLSPAFASGTTEYTSSVASAVSSITVTASVYDKNATMTVNGNPVASGQASGAINLQVGSNPITIVVTAQNGTTKTYSVTVNRASAASTNADLSSLSLSNGTLSPAFASGTTEYTSSVASAVSSLTVSASVYDKNATMTVNGDSVTSGQASGPINLQVGSNPITIVVTAQDGTTKTYIVTVNRAPAASTNADLSSLTLSNGILSPAFASGTTAYTSSVAVGVSSLTVSASVYDKNATITVNGNSVTSGQGSGPINLQIGNNIINIVVTAQDGTTKTYNVTVTRVPSSSSSRPSSGGSSVTTPSDSKVTATDGKLTLPAGKSGEVSLGSEIVISIPANASSKELKLTIEKLADTQALLKNKEALLSSIFEILKNFPENFSNPVTLTFTFNPASLKNNQTAGVFYYDEVKKVWVEVKGSKINGNKITAEVDHFTKYAVLAVDSMADKPTVSLSDIIGHWAEATIKKAVGNGIVSGYPDGTFKPNNTVTRAEFAVMLMNTLKPQGEGAALTFTDTAKIGSWAQKAVAQAYQAGIVKGYEDGSFRPDAQITRAEMAVMLANALGLTIEANTATGFADDKDVPAWAKGAVAAMKKQQLVEGKGDNEFAPTASTTRAEAVTVLLKMLAQKSNK